MSLNNNLPEANPQTEHKHKSWRYGSYSVGLSLLAILIVVIVNLVINALPATMTKIDASSTQIYNLSDQTKEILAGLEDDINIYLIVEAGSENRTVVELIRRYTNLSDKIHFSKIDPVLYPNFSKQYTEDDLQNNSVIVESPKRGKVINNSDIFVDDYTYAAYTGTYDRSFDGEGQITSAIKYVTSEQMPVLYTLSGHGETTLSLSQKGSITKENIEVKDLNLLTTLEVPADAKCILIYAPTMDLTAQEVEIVQAYLENNGNLLLISDYSETAMPNLAQLMEGYGVERVDGVIIEQAAGRYALNYYNFLVPELQKHDITNPLIASNLITVFPQAQGIKELDAYRQTLTIKPLLTTSESSYSKLAGYSMTTSEKEEGDIDGPFNLGVAIEEDFGEDKQTKIVWFGTSQFLADNELMEVAAGSNSDLFLNSLGWLCDNDTGMSIRTHSLNSQKLNINDRDSMLWKIFFVGLVPAAVLIFGLAVWLDRRKR